MGTRIKKMCSEGGLEGNINTIGLFLLGFGVVGCLAAIIVSGYVTELNDSLKWVSVGFSFGWIAVAVTSLFMGVLAYVFCKGLAEIIRLHKKGVNLPYGGRISETWEKEKLVCSECNYPVSEVSFRKCYQCGITFENQT